MSFGVRNSVSKSRHWELRNSRYAIRVVFSAKIRRAQPLLAYTNIPLRKHREMRTRPQVSPGCLCFTNENKYRYISQTPGGEYCIPPKQPPVPPLEIAKGKNCGFL